MSKHIIEKEAPKDYRVPENIPVIPKVKQIIADPPWSRGQSGKLGAIQKYDLMSLERIKAMPVKQFAADNSVLWLWSTNSGLEDALSVVKAWGFEFKGYYCWTKDTLGLGSFYLRNSSELLLYAIRGKVKFKNHSQRNYGAHPVMAHSEKPRELYGMFERMYDGPALELFCRRRPMHSDEFKVYCWGRECQGGSDIFIPGYPVPEYSFEKRSTQNADDNGDKVNSDGKANIAKTDDGGNTTTHEKEEV